MITRSYFKFLNMILLSFVAVSLSLLGVTIVNPGLITGFSTHTAILISIFAANFYFSPITNRPSIRQTITNSIRILGLAYLVISFYPGVTEHVDQLLNPDQDLHSSMWTRLSLLVILICHAAIKFSKNISTAKYILLVLIPLYIPILVLVSHALGGINETLVHMSDTSVTMIGILALIFPMRYMYKTPIRYAMYTNVSSKRSMKYILLSTGIILTFSIIFYSLSAVATVEFKSDLAFYLAIAMVILAIVNVSLTVAYLAEGSQVEFRNKQHERLQDDIIDKIIEGPYHALVDSQHVIEQRQQLNNISIVLVTFTSTQEVTYQVNDLASAKISSIISSSIRASDQLMMWDNNKFVIILKNVDEEDSVQHIVTGIYNKIAKSVFMNKYMANFEYVKPQILYYYDLGTIPIQEKIDDLCEISFASNPCEDKIVNSKHIKI